jgi:hypothetical protein
MPPVPDISKFDETADLPLILAAILLVDVIVICIARFTGLFGTVINVWYDRFGLSAVLADVGIIFLGFIVGRWIYTKYIRPRYGWDAWIFTALMIVIQMVHDVLFYVDVIKPLAPGDNGMIDVMKDYSLAGGWKILIADAGMVAASAGIAMAYKLASVPVVTGITALAGYAMPYLLAAASVKDV